MTSTAVKRLRDFAGVIKIKILVHQSRSGLTTKSMPKRIRRATNGRYTEVN